MGFVAPGDERVPVPFRDYNALKLAIWRSKVALDICAKQSAEIVERCQHAPGCPGKEHDAEPCLRECPDREQRMSALVVLNAAKTLGPVDARKVANEQYFAPTREYYTEILAELAAAQAELATRRACDPPVSPIDMKELPTPAPAT